MKSDNFLKGSTSLPTKAEVWLAFPLILVIYLYRWVFSPVLGNSCRFHPTCSQYAEEALRKHGAIRGSIMAARRLLRCHPWHSGGYDPVT